MRRIKILGLILFLFSINTSAQNFLSPLWKISFTNTAEALQHQFNTADWKHVNILLSWERQGYFWHDGKCCIANDFALPAYFKDSTLILSFSLQCNVESIYINGKYIGGKIPNQFWTNRGAKTEFILQKDCISAATKNRIMIFVSDLSYTGGRSHNYCSLSPKFANNFPDIKIIVPGDDHLFSVDDKTKKINLEYKVQQQGAIQLSIVNDFHESFVNKTFEVAKGDGVISFSFENIITRPGFYECVAILNDGSYSSDVQWFSLSPDKIECTNNTTPGFKQYWDEALNELSQVKPEFI